MSERKFYKTIIHFTVLSEEPIPPQASLEYIANESRDGIYVGDFGVNDEIILSSHGMANALYDAGSEPGFFGLNDEGEGE